MHGIGKGALEMGAGGVGSGEREKRAIVARQAQHSGRSYRRYQQEAGGDTAFRLPAGR